jgi:hypothetical protein
MPENCKRHNDRYEELKPHILSGIFSLPQWLDSPLGAYAA